MLLVVAAGNNSQDIDKDPFYPAAYSNGNILCVSAITATGSLASFSDFGSKNVDLGAPGSNIVSTYPTSVYKVLSGTSMATPFVTAAAAMLREQNSDLTYSKLRSLIKSHVTPNPALAGNSVTDGQLNVAGALSGGRLTERELFFIPSRRCGRPWAAASMLDKFYGVVAGAHGRRGAPSPCVFVRGSAE